MVQLLIPAIISVLDKVLPDEGKAQEAKARILEMQVKGELDQIAGQIQINLEEAKNPNLFVSGWRPAVGWIGATALGYASIFEPLARFVATVFFGYSGQFPQIDTNLTLQVLLGILGLGVFRTYEKKNQVASK